MPSDEKTPKPTYTALGGRTVLVGTLGLVLIAIALVSWMVWTTRIPAPSPGIITPAERTDQEVKRTQLRVDIIRNSLGILAGLGGLAALVLAVRRQYQKERIDVENQNNQDRSHGHQILLAEDARHDATERRITELQIKAADQLGNDKAPVRLAGLYALERLAHDNLQHRQLVVDIVCAYLRMPHPAFPEPDPRYVDQQSGDDILAPLTSQAAEEIVVRTSAQQILTRHSRPKSRQPDGSYVPNPLYWPSVATNLSGAALLRFSARDCTLYSADFSNAQFYGESDFFRTTFVGKTILAGTEFHNRATFTAATFERLPLFSRTKFAESPEFAGARVTHYAAGETVDLPEGWKLIPHQNGEGGLQFVLISHPVPGIKIVPDEV